MGMTEEQRNRIALEFPKLIETKRVMAKEAKERAGSPPLPSLGVLYHEIAEQDERHVAILETIATRYGYTPSRFAGGGMIETLGRLKEKFVAMGASTTDQLWHDVRLKAKMIQAQTEWIAVLESLGDEQSVNDLASVLSAEQAHHDALFNALKQHIEEPPHAAEED